MTDKTEYKSAYEKELITSEVIKSMYGFGFNDLMQFVQEGKLVAFPKQQASGSITYRFRRGDIIRITEEDING